MSTLQISLWKAALRQAARDLNRNHIMSFAAALSYYFVMSLFPALILLAAVLVLLPLPNLFGQILDLMSRFVPADSMRLIRRVSTTVISPNGGGLLSFGILGVVWTVSSGFSAVIEALNVAYDVPETRPFWKTRLLALGMAFGVGGLFLLAVVFQVLGPDFGAWLTRWLQLGPVVAVVWPFLRWGVTLAFAVGGIVATYKIAPNIRQTLAQILPGAVLATIGWVALSYGLGFYFRSFANFNKTYGVLGAAVALMVWVYYTGFIILVGAEVNSELIQVTGDGHLELKEPPPEKVKPQPATETDAAA